MAHVVSRHVLALVGTKEELKHLSDSGPMERPTSKQASERVGRSSVLDRLGRTRGSLLCGTRGLTQAALGGSSADLRCGLLCCGRHVARRSPLVAWLMAHGVSRHVLALACTKRQISST